MVSTSVATRHMLYSEASPLFPRISSQETFPDSTSQEEEMKGTKRKISLSNCGVCGFEEAKYKCPACLTLSCSLLCVKKHKEESRCSGVRNKTAFVNLSQFDEITLLSDYRFLEDTGRFAGSAQRDNLICVPHTRGNARTNKLKVNARKMNITLRILPSTFTKHKENSTIFNFREKVFLWHLKIVFPQSGTEFSQKRVCERLTLEQILTPYIHPTESDPVIRQKLKRYVLTPIEEVNVFMKAEGRKANSVRYHKLDLRKSLRDNLSYKILIEYPLLHVVLREHWKDFPLKESAEPASTYNKCEIKGVSMGQSSEDIPLCSPSSVCPPTNRDDIFTATLYSPESLPPLEKKLKRELGEEDLEEGEIPDSEDEEKEIQKVVH
ncbi:box C/D snoRNA protein 1 [Corythoichthys intestinalis]|uniref:box C/D snoRNA protein 1 n=1 Tax=Corythoichthys intestinalis TaxID=161448 RepID=UPI0025A5E728|nr:box C/D snoRNA protein 1 [Corythoichthys intestinalis]